MQKFGLFFLILLYSLTLSANSSVKVSLESETQEQKIGGVFVMLMNFDIAQNAHIYSNESQNIGIPTKVEWTLPMGFQLIDEDWPDTKEFEFFGEKAEGFSGNIQVRYTFKASKYSAGEFHLDAKVSWLECSNICTPAESTLRFTGNVIGTPPPRVTLFHIILLIPLSFLGGLLLNAMPCVFPVVGIKILSFIKSANENRKTTILNALLYSLGIILSFLALGLILIWLKSISSSYGWGFQLQEPFFVALLCILFFSIALNFSGYFEFGASLGNISFLNTTKNQYLYSFLSGVLAVIAASPCTAPFMGSAIGIALLDSENIMTVIFTFTFLGVGMATPYVVLTLFPKLLNKLPKPGKWMNTLKEFLAFPLYATAIWLLWVFSIQTSVNASATLLVALLGIAFAAWIFTKWGVLTASKTQRFLVYGICLFILAGVLHIAFHSSRASDEVVQENTIFDEAEILRLRKSGHYVFVDFTAAWCMTCQANDRAVLNTQRVKDLFERNNVVKIVIDWTNKDTHTAKILAKFGRAGVPLYLLYSPDLEKKVEILPAILSYNILSKKIDKTAQ